MSDLHSTSELLERSPWTFTGEPSSVIAIALHNGHDIREELADLVQIDPADRRREEDPYTSFLTEVAPTRVVVHRSRFEVDLNRPPDDSLCIDPADCWGLDIWRQQPGQAAVDRSRYLHAAFYSELRELLSETARYGRFVVLDVHCYNHRRDGPNAEPADATANPDVNVGTGSLDRDRWSNLVDRFIADLSHHPARLDVRENVRFKGRYLASWIHSEFAETGCCLALEFKKTFMDEWTGELDVDRFELIREALASTLPGIEQELLRS
jgi:N-formylglutamate deformylase